MADPSTGGSLALNNQTVASGTRQKLTGGETYTITATPNANYTFDGWYEGLTLRTKQTSMTFVANSSTAYIAKFTYHPPTHIVHYSITNPRGGTINGRTSGDAECPEGGTITLRAVPDSGYRTGIWREGTYSAESGTFTIQNIQADRTITHTFIAICNVNVSANPSEGGICTIDGQNIASRTFDHGKRGTIVKAIPQTGYTFDHWRVNGVDKPRHEAPETFTLPELKTDYTLVAYFRANPTYNVTARANETSYGSVVISPVEGPYMESSTVTLTATPAEGYELVNWTDAENNIQLAGASNAFEYNVTKDITIVANFRPKSYAIAATASPAEGGSVSGTGSYAYGTTVTLTASANSGFTFSKWTENGTDVSTNATLTFSANANRNLVAVFNENEVPPVNDKYTVTLTYDESKGFATGSGIYTANTNATLQANPEQGYHFEGWYKDNNLLSTSNPFSYQVKENCEIEARFTCYCHTLSTTSAGFGTISDGSGSANYFNNTRCQWLIQPNDATSITLSFTEFKTQANTDIVEIYDGSEARGSNLLGSYSGDLAPFSVTAPSGSMLVVFTTDNTVSDEGWTANYTADILDEDYLTYADDAKTIVIGCDPRMTSVRIPSRVVEIRPMAFSNCDRMVSVSIPESVTKINAKAFYGCEALTTVTIPSSVTFLGEAAFAGCTALRNVKLNTNLETIADSLFTGCSALTTIVFPEGLQTIGRKAFLGCGNIYSINLPATLQTVGEKAFSDMSGLHIVTLNGGNTTFGGNCFTGSQNITLTNFKGDINQWLTLTFVNEEAQPTTYSKNLAFQGDLVTNLVIPDGVTTIKDYAFYKNEQIQSIELPATVATIGDKAFAGLATLQHIVLSSLPTVQDNTFLETNRETPIILPCELIQTAKNWDNGNGWGGFKHFVAENAYTLTLDNQPGGIIHILEEPTCGNNTYVLHAVPAARYTFVRWSDGNTDAHRTLNLTNNEVLTAIWERSTTPTALAADTVVYFNNGNDTASWFCDNNGINRWHVGDAVNYSRGGALYITNDNGVTNNYSNASKKWATDGNASVHSDVYFEAGTYIVKFYWRGGGDAHDYMTASLIPDIEGVDPVANRINLSDKLYSNIDDWFLNKRLVEVPQSGWYKFTFDWFCDHADTYTNGAAVDKIEILFQEAADINDMAINVSVMSDDETMGTAVSKDESGNARRLFFANENVTLEATAAPGYHFVNWSDGSTNAIVTYKASRLYGATLIAYFAEDRSQYNVTANISNSNAAQVSGSGSYDLNSTAQLSVDYIQYGWAFAGWDNGVSDNPYLLNVTSDTVVTAIMVDVTSAIAATPLYVSASGAHFDTIFLHDTIYLPIPKLGNEATEIINAKVYTENGQIVVEESENNAVRLFDVNGRLLATQQDEFAPLRFDVAISGTYVISIGSKYVKKVVVVR